MKNLFIVQHGLVDRHSHYYGETKGWVEACRARAISPILYINRRALPEITRELSAKAVFPFPPDAILERDPNCHQLSDYLTLAENFAQSCAELEQDGIGGDDVLLIPYSTESDLLGVGLWLERLAAPRRPTIILIFHLPSFAWKIEADRTGITGDISWFRYAMKRVRAVMPPEKIIIRATTLQLANALGNIFEHRCEKCPVAAYYMDPDILRPCVEQAGPRVKVRVAGQFRWEKGSAIVVPVILEVTRARPGLSFALQVEDAQQAEGISKQLAPIAETSSQCYVAFGNPSHEVYLSRLVQSDILLLPYRPERYALRTSGVFAEAVGFGVVTVVPNRTWMADMLNEGWGGGTIFNEAVVGDVAAAVIGAIDAYSTLLPRAQRTAAAWRQVHSVDALLDHVLKAAGMS